MAGIAQGWYLGARKDFQHSTSASYHRHPDLSSQSVTQGKLEHERGITQKVMASTKAWWSTVLQRLRGLNPNQLARDDANRGKS